MQIEQREVIISTPDGEMPAFLCLPAENSRKPGIMLLMEAFGLTQHIKDVAVRIAKEGYVVITPDLYYRELPNNKFDYDEVEKAKAMMYRLDLKKTMEEDIKAVLAYLKSRVDVLYPDRIGVTGFCFGGSMTFYTATRFSPEIVVAAPFYSVVLDEWLEAVTDITIPVYLFFGGADPFISGDRINQIDSRFKELNKEYKLKVYPQADHGFFCHERSSYNQLAAEDAWRELKQFFHKHLKKNW
ncbi:MAG: dienelactone hydrolase family protein [Xenococcaceae cyanobacterium MO_207.B15]|nr:dienelactone hydrolase family protein [Xenococcaceae cyanobacterium MO_207.B15]MDJ0742025.1 dienelactone hydrolase family protein [Xenococcaceae cyanobacterium MO_167.B27]